MTFTVKRMLKRSFKYLFAILLIATPEGRAATAEMWQAASRTAGVIASSVSEARAADQRTQTSGTPDTPSAKTYVVRPGDTLFDLARKHRTSIARILAANPGLVSPTNIRAGTEIVLP